MIQMLFGFLIGFAGVVVGAVIIGSMMRKVFSENKPEKIEFSVANKLSNEFRSSVDKLIAVSNAHEAVKNTHVSDMIKKILKQTNELFNRMEKNGDTEKTLIASVQYADIFDKLSIALGEDLYLDTLKHPDYWTEPKKIRDDAEKSLNLVYEQIIRNIKRVNAKQDIDFRVAINALNNYGNETPIEEFLKETEDKKEGTA